MGDTRRRTYRGTGKQAAFASDSAVSGSLSYVVFNLYTYMAAVNIWFDFSLKIDLLQCVRGGTCRFGYLSVDNCFRKGDGSVLVVTVMGVE